MSTFVPSFSKRKRGRSKDLDRQTEKREKEKTLPPPRALLSNFLISFDQRGKARHFPRDSREEEEIGLVVCACVAKEEGKERRKRKKKKKTLSFSLTVRRAARSLSHTTESDKEAKKKDLLFKKK